MSETVIDQLVAKLRLDPKGFKQGAAEADRAIKSTESTVKHSAEAMASAIGRVALEFTGLFLAIRGVSDIVSLFTGLNQQITQLGINSKNMGLAANELRDWQEVSELAGGSAEDATRSISGMQQAIFNLKFKGEMSDQLIFLARMGVQFQTASGSMRNFRDIALQTAKALESSGWDRATRFMYAQQAGFSGGMANAIAEGSRALQDYIKTAESAQQVSDRQAETAKKLNGAWVDLKYALSGAAAQILTNLTPSLIALFDTLKDVGPQKLQEFADWIKGDGAKAIGGFFSGLNTVIRDTATALDMLGTALHPVISGWSKLIAIAKSPATALHKLQIKAAQSNFDRAAAIQAAMSPSDPRYAAARAATTDAAASLQRMIAQFAPSAEELAADDTTDASKAESQRGYRTALSDAERRYGIPTGVLTQLAQTESNLNPNLTSPKGAVGIMQLMPKYFKGAGTNPYVDIDTGAKYLAKLYGHYGDWAQAVAAYNAGQGRIDDVLAGKATLPAETRNYVGKVLGQGAPGALAAARGSGASAGASSAGATTVDKSVTIDTMNVSTQATDANGISADMQRAIQRKFNVAYADAGVF